MNEFDYKTLLEKRWRHKLTAAEEASVRAWLAQHPESKADWDLDAQLSEALEKLPNVPISSNFTARVLQAVEREAKAPQSSSSRMPWFFRVLLPRAAVASLILAVGLVTYREHTSAKRAVLVQGVKMVAGVASLPDPDTLQNFDIIRQLPASMGPDRDLIEAMK